MKPIWKPAVRPRPCEFRRVPSIGCRPVPGLSRHLRDGLRGGIELLAIAAQKALPSFLAAPSAAPRERQFLHAQSREECRDLCRAGRGRKVAVADLIEYRYELVENDAIISRPGAFKKLVGEAQLQRR